MEPVANAVSNPADPSPDQATQPVPAAPATGGAKPPVVPAAAPVVTEDKMRQLVGEEIGNIRQQEKQDAAQQKVKNDWINDPNNGVATLPGPYKSMLGNDPKLWPAEADAARREWDKYVADNGIILPKNRSPAVSNPPAKDNRSAAEMIAAGLRTRANRRA